MDRNQVLEKVRAAEGGGVRPGDLAARLGLAREARPALHRLIEELLAEGAIERARGGRLRVPGAGADGADGAGRDRSRAGERPAAGAVPGVIGRIRVHPAGYGFVEREDGDEDVFVAARHRGGAMDGDRVEILTFLGHKGPEGRVGRILERGRARLTGTLRAAGGAFLLEPDDPRVHGQVTVDEPGGATPGQAVLCEITRYPEAPGQPLAGRVIHVLGAPDDPRTEVAKVLSIAGIPERFSEEAAQAGQRAPEEVRPEDLVDRVDLRDREFVTCDPETARDFDDAVCVEERAGGFRLWVAVADVSHYVRVGTALDREARARGFSVYLPDRAIPMLPEALSAGICSLNPEVDRLAMVCRLDYGPDGAVREALHAAAVIRSRARLDYGGVAAALAGDFRGERARYRDHLPHLSRMRELAARLRKRREARGALDFDLQQAQVLLDDDDPRRVRDVRRSKPSEEVKLAYGLVEDFMLAANEAVAAFFRSRALDAIWRVHDKPDPVRIAEFSALAEAYGITVRPEESADPRALRRAAAELRGKPAERALSYLLLRSLKQAVYDVVPIGHFGLATADYLHFTSPIRRYPDLVVHRLLKRQLHLEGLPSGGRHHLPAPPADVLRQMAAETSALERRAMEAEREVVDMYRAYLMRDRLGEELSGRVSGVTAFGIFVEIDEPFVEGMVRVASLGEAFELDPERLRLVAPRSGRALSLGDPVRVRIEDVSVARRRIELALLEGGRTLEPAALAPPEGRDRRRRRAAVAEGGRRGRAKEVGRRRGGGGPKKGHKRRGDE